MTSTERVEAIKVLTETLQVLSKLLFMGEEENKKGMKLSPNSFKDI